MVCFDGCDMKLTIELVPSTCFESNLRSVLSRSDWDKIRKSTYEKAGHVCEICGGKGSRHPVECHEIWEYDDKSHVQKLVGLQALCPKCHMVKHYGRTREQGLEQVALAHLCKVNNIDEHTAYQHVLNAFLVWENRSIYEWKQDTSFMEDPPHG